MSFIQVSAGVLAKDSWGSVVSNSVYDVRPFHKLTHWEIVPILFDDLCDWAFVTKNYASRDYTRPYHVLYKEPTPLPPSNRVTLYPVTIRFQGKLGSFNLGVLGNWAGEPSDAASAMQYLCLNARDNLPAWEASLRTIQNFKRLVASSAVVGRYKSEKNPDIRRDIRFHRRVFLKKKRGDPAESVGVHISDDPNNWYRRVSNEWTLSKKLQVGRMVSEGNAVAMNVMALSVGDFVDVGASVDVAVTRSPDGRLTSKVHFVLNHVLLISKGSPSNRKRRHEEFAQDDSTSYTIQPSVMNFDVVPESMNELNQVQDLAPASAVDDS